MKSSQTHLASLLSSLLFILGALLFLAVALLMGITALSNFMTGTDVQAQQTIVLAVFGFEGVILLVATFISIQKFLYKPSADRDSSFTISIWQVVVSLVIAGVVLFLGSRISLNDSVNWLVLPILTLPAVVLPLFVLFGLGVREIPLGTRWQTWNVFGIGMTLVPFTLIILEVVAMIFVLVIVIIFLISQPALTTEMQRLSEQIYRLGPQSQATLDLLLPYITKPAVIAVALSYFALLIPLLEEVFKTLGVWFFAGKLTSRAQGFAMGALSGSAYALIETLGVSAQTADWATLLLTRIGTGVLHITTSALVGAAIVGALRERRYMQLLGTYFLAVLLHGLWNAQAILYTFATLTKDLAQQNPLSGLETPVTIGMVILAVVLFIILLVSNRRMRGTVPQPVHEEAIT
ncbi:MAG: PrsW family glutamic-type intramembrane protease [Chloroflexota bacterium]